MAVSTRHLHRKHIRNQRQRESAAAARDGFRGEQHHTDAPKDDILEERSAKIAKFLFNGDGLQDDMPSMRDSDALWLALCLQPMNIRNELIIQLFEAIAIFAALFLNGVWILYEWVSVCQCIQYDISNVPLCMLTILRIGQRKGRVWR